MPAMARGRAGRCSVFLKGFLAAFPHYAPDGHEHDEESKWRIDYRGSGDAQPVLKKRDAFRPLRQPFAGGDATCLVEGIIKTATGGNAVQQLA